MAFKFEKLQVWQKALDLTEKVDYITRTFPGTELYVLTSQMKRAADSIALNIAEGSMDKAMRNSGSFWVMLYAPLLKR